MCRSEPHIARAALAKVSRRTPRILVRDTSGCDLNNDVVGMLNLWLRYLSDADFKGFLVVDRFHGGHCARACSFPNLTRFKERPEEDSGVEVMGVNRTSDLVLLFEVVGDGEDHPKT